MVTDPPLDAEPAVAAWIVKVVEVGTDKTWKFISLKVAVVTPVVPPGKVVALNLIISPTPIPRSVDVV